MSSTQCQATYSSEEGVSSSITENLYDCRLDMGISCNTQNIPVYRYLYQGIKIPTEDERRRDMQRHIDCLMKPFNNSKHGTVQDEQSRTV
ncbi:unnamed protein product [Clonostachys rosea]|uniref:Uncharacterized protein n=1 Tax=Bionectria ochroleuca TaxID=29856 RepID=A0ABY6ULM3_BIOOC|nr:unnamed protein product [Clonostachys rosea]